MKISVSKGRIGQSCLERKSYVDTKKGTNRKKGSDIMRPIDLCCESSEDEIRFENVSHMDMAQIIFLIRFKCKLSYSLDFCK